MTIYLSSVDALIGCSMAGRCLDMIYSCCCKRRGCASYDTRWTLFFLHCGAFSYLHDGDFEATQSDIGRGGTCFGASAVLSAPATSSLAHGWPRSRDYVARVLAQPSGTRLRTAASVFHDLDFGVRVRECAASSRPGGRGRPIGWYRGPVTRRPRSGSYATCP